MNGLLCLPCFSGNCNHDSDGDYHHKENSLEFLPDTVEVEDKKDDAEEKYEDTEIQLHHIMVTAKVVHSLVYRISRLGV